jgi:2,2-dialkylglycine decarboxylase (pyruvate)
VQFLSTGGESVEAGLRMAKLHTGRFEVVGLTCSWHGMTGAANASTYSAGRRAYGPAVPGAMALPAPHSFRCPVRHCRDKCDMTCLDVGMDLVDRQSVGSMAVVIVEPILGAGGIIPLPPGYLQRLRKICDERGMLLMLDEAQTALGRCGNTFAFEQHGVVPDILALSKTLGAGLPLAATITSEAIEDDCACKGFLHYTSHTSDPLAAEVGLAALKVVLQEGLSRRARDMGRYVVEGLRKLQAKYEQIGDVRGEGLLLGLEVVTDRETRTPDHPLVRRISVRLLELGVHMAMLRDGGSGWRVAPPLTVSHEEADKFLSILDVAFGECLRAPRRRSLEP